MFVASYPRDDMVKSLKDLEASTDHIVPLTSLDVSTTNFFLPIAHSLFPLSFLCSCPSTHIQDRTRQRTETDVDAVFPASWLARLGRFV